MEDESGTQARKNKTQSHNKQMHGFVSVCSPAAASFLEQTQIWRNCVEWCKGQGLRQKRHNQPASQLVLHPFSFSKHSCVTADLICASWNTPVWALHPQQVHFTSWAVIRWVNSQLNVRWNAGPGFSLAAAPNSMFHLTSDFNRAPPLSCLTPILWLICWL